MVNIDPGEVKKGKRKCKIGNFVGGRFDRRAEEQTRQNTRKSLEIQVECLPDCTIFKLNSKVTSLLWSNPEHLILGKTKIPIKTIEFITAVWLIGVSNYLIVV